ncbi:MAG: hypothetical protein AB7V55_02820 [Oscillospiraceae bacterium]
MNPVLMEKDALIDEMMARERQRKFIPEAERRPYGEYAWEKGRKTAARIQQQHPGRTAMQIAEEMGLKIEEKDGPGFNLSEYTSGQKRITLFPNTIQSDFIDAEAEHLATTDYAEVRQLFLAHELFHHLECTDPAVGITYRERQVVVFSAGPFKWKTGLRCLSEIAAHSFALQLAGASVLR